MTELQRLTEDAMPYVQQAALKSIREAKKITTKVYEKNDPTTERLFALIKKMNPRNVREAYSAALQVGQIFYRELAGITTHELKTSAVLISGLANQLVKLSQEGDLEELEENRAKLRQSVDDLLKIVSGLSDLSREPQKNEVIDIESVIQQAIQEARASHKGEEVIYNGSNSESKILGDPTFLVIALRNLIINAIEANPPNKNVIVSIVIRETKVMISVQDQGMGMTEQQITEAFKPFSSTKKDRGGMGMGIPIAQKIIHFDFGGELRYESEPGKGTKVIVELPINRETVL
jgi:signal transduction histidine kinase